MKSDAPSKKLRLISLQKRRQQVNRSRNRRNLMLQATSRLKTLKEMRSSDHMVSLMYR